MTHNYKSPVPAEAGTYLVRVDGDELVAAVFDGTDWEQPGSDFDVWNNVFDADTLSSYEIEVLCKLNLETLAAGPTKYQIGDLTMKHIFAATGMTHVGNLQAVFDQVEKVLVAIEPKH